MRSKEHLPKISIIIVNLNGKKWLDKCIPSVINSNYFKGKMEIILVDNGSTDGSIDFVRCVLKNKKIKLKIIENNENKGWSPANNQGAEIAEGNILLFLSNDMEVDKNWIKEITKIFKLDNKTGVVQCNSISMWDRKTLDSSMNYLDRYGFAYGYAPQERPYKVFFAEGMAFAIRKNVFDMIDGFDEYYFMEYDDMDLCWRARLTGHQVYFAPKSRVYHARGGTVGKTYFDRIPNVKTYTRNHFVTLIKNYEMKHLVKILPMVLIIEIAKVLYLLIIKRNMQVAFAALKGIFQVLKDWKIILEKRKNVQSIRKVSDEEIMKYMHPFRPDLIYSFIVSQSRGERFILDIKPPIRGLYGQK
jgi:GT2 family glycosyltransferase